MGLVIDTMRAGYDEALAELYRRATWASHQHHPSYAQFVPPEAGVRTTLVGYRAERPCAYANIIERGRALARLRFGPVYVEPEDAADFIVGLVNHYRRRGFLRLEVQLYEPAGERGEWIAYRVARDCRFVSEVTSKSWTTAVVPLSGRTEDGSDVRLSTNHRRNVKKARRLGLRTEPMSASDVAEFSDQYIRMYRSRRLPISSESARARISGKFAFIRETGEGLALKVLAADGTMLGGLLVMREGERAFYDLGATDPGRRDVPIFHLGILDSFTWASAAGCSLFDLGGYGFLANDACQIGQINRFKDGFRPHPLFFTRGMRFALSPAGGYLFDIAVSARRRVTQRIALRPDVSRSDD